jgi:t-SNARE complex subunit (syntaxin)
VIWPVLRPSDSLFFEEDDPLTELINRKDTVLQAIKDLEFDYQVGKIDDEDFERLNAQLRRQALGLLKQIEKIAPDTTNLEQKLEKSIAKHRRVEDSRPSRQNGAVNVRAGKPVS